MSMKVSTPPQSLPLCIRDSSPLQEFPARAWVALGPWEVWKHLFLDHIPPVIKRLYGDEELERPRFYMWGIGLNVECKPLHVGCG